MSKIDTVIKVPAPVPSVVRVCLLWLLLCAARVTLAGQDIADVETSYLGEIPVIVSATRLRQKQTEAPATITIIDREMIAASFVDEMAWYGDGNDMDGHTRVDLRLARRFKGERHSGAIEFLVHYIGGKFSLFSHDHIFDTRYYLRASLQFH